MSNGAGCHIQQPAHLCASSSGGDGEAICVFFLKLVFVPFKGGHGGQDAYDLIGGCRIYLEDESIGSELFAAMISRVGAATPIDWRTSWSDAVFAQVEQLVS